MKKFLPLIIIGAGILIVIAAVIIVMNMFKSAPSSGPTAENVPELPQSQWPVVTLTPTEDTTVPNSLGHFLEMRIQKINVPGAATMDYLLVYTTSDGGQQGVPGTVKLAGDIDKKLLMGSASSGKYRFDAGVSTGTLTITFRDGNGKSLGKLSAMFHLQFGDTVLTSADNKFTYTLSKAAPKVYFVTMPTFVQPDASLYVVWQNGYGVFASDGKPHAGTVSSQ